MSELTKARDRYARARLAAEVARVALAAAVIAERENGRTLADIGAELGLSRSRVCQIVGAGTGSAGGAV